MSTSRGSTSLPRIRARHVSLVVDEALSTGRTMKRRQRWSSSSTTSSDRRTGDNTDNQGDEKGLATSLTIVDSNTCLVWSTGLPHNGRWKYAEVGATKWSESLGHTCMILSSASENSPVTFVDAIRDATVSETPRVRITTRRSPRYSKQTSGAAEVST